MSEGIIRVVLATRRPFPIYPSRPTCGRSLDFVGMGQDLAHDPQQTTFVIRSPRRRGQATWVAPSGPAPLRRDFECSVPISDIRFNRRVSVEESGRRAAGRTVEPVCMTEIERSVLTAMFNRVVYPEDLRDAAGSTLPRRTFSIRLSRSAARCPRCRGARYLIGEISRRRRPQRRRHPVLSLAGADGFRPVPESRNWLSRRRLGPRVNCNGRRTS